MAYLTEEPESNSIMALEGHLLEVWSEAHNRFADDDRFMNETFAIWPASLPRPRRYTGKGPSIVAHAVDNLLTADPQFHREPVGGGKEHKADADELEAWLSASWMATMRDQAIHPLKQLARHLTLYGYGILEGPLLRPGWAIEERPERGDFDSDEDYDDAVVQFELRRLGQSPFTILAPPPTTVLLHPKERIPTEAVKRAFWYSVDLAELTKRRKARGRKAEVWEVGHKPFDKVECIEYWSAGWHALMVHGGQMLFVEKNTWGFVPFTQGFAGWGHQPTDYRNENPVYWARGILQDAKDSIVMLTQHRISKHQVYMGSAWLKMRTSKDAQDIQQQLEGDIVGNIAEGEIGYLPFPDYPAWTAKQEQDYERDIEAATYVGSLAGQRQEGVTTVGQQAILDTSASRKFLQPLKQMEYMSSVVSGHMLRLVEVLGGKVVIDGKSLGLRSIGHNYIVGVKYEVVDPVLHLQVKEEAQREYDRKLLHKEGYWEVARKENATKIREGLIEDLVYEHPAVVQAAALLIAQGLGLGGVLQGQGEPGVQGTPLSEAGEPLMQSPTGAGIQMPPRGAEAAAQAEKQMRQALSPRVAKPALVNLGPLARGGG